jgi:histidine triad (HIT) family protein
MTKCVFCEIVNNRIPSYKVYEDDRILAFLDHKPVRPGHVLIIPKIHIDHMIDLEKDLFLHIVEVAHRIGRNIQEKLNPLRVGFVVAGFGVPHAHYHVIPMFSEHDITSERYALLNNGEIVFSIEAIDSPKHEQQMDVLDLIKIQKNGA